MIRKITSILISPIPLILIWVFAKLHFFWMVLSLLVLLPTPLALTAWVIILIKTFFTPWLIFPKTLYLLVFAAVVWYRDGIDKKAAYKVSLLFLVLTITPLSFPHLGNIWSIENTALLTYGFLAIGVIQDKFSGIFTPKKRIGIFEFLNLIVSILTLVYSFLDEKRHDVIEKYYVPSSEILRKYWPQIVRASYSLVLMSVSFYPAYLAFIKERDRVKLFVNFFPSGQLYIYLLSTGIFELPLLLVTIILISTVYLSKKITFKIPIIISIFFISRAIAGSIYLSTTKNIRDKAYIWSVTPNQVSEIWTDITVTGVNFKERPFDAFIYVNDIPHRVISWTDREVVFRTDPTLTESGKIRLVNIDGVGSNEVDFTYTPPK